MVKTAQSHYNSLLNVIRLSLGLHDALSTDVRGADDRSITKRRLSLRFSLSRFPVISVDQWRRDQAVTWSCDVTAAEAGFVVRRRRVTDGGRVTSGQDAASSIDTRQSTGADRRRGAVARRQSHEIRKAISKRSW